MRKKARTARTERNAALARLDRANRCAVCLKDARQYVGFLGERRICSADCLAEALARAAAGTP